MIDKYKHDPEGVSTVITSLKADKDEYSKEVENIKYNKRYRIFYCMETSSS